MLYRVNPVFGFVEPGAKMSIDVLRHNGEKKTDNLVVITSDVSSFIHSFFEFVGIFEKFKL